MAQVCFDTGRLSLRTCFGFTAIALGIVGLGAAPAVASPVPVNCFTAENCTSNDLQLTNITVEADASDATCSGPGDTINLRVTQSLDSTGGSKRYDVGTGVDISGGAGTDCMGDILVPPNTSGSTHELNSNTCPDLNGTDVATYSAVYTFPCTDANHDGLLDPIEVIAIWANNSGDNPTCASADDAFPSSLGTTAKCKILASPSTGIDVPDCGNGVVEPGEQCDDGNTASGDGCSATCQIENIPTSCGNGVVDSGEQCDDGNNISGDGCSAACVAEFCGDGVTQVGLGETCDDGNTRSGDGCSANCTIEQPVPAVGGWGMAALTLLLAGAGYLALRRRTRTV